MTVQIGKLSAVTVALGDLDRHGQPPATSPAMHADEAVRGGEHSAVETFGHRGQAVTREQMG